MAIKFAIWLAFQFVIGFVCGWLVASLFLAMTPNVSSKNKEGRQ